MSGKLRPNTEPFPLAIPLLSGPGTITTVLLLTHQADASILRMGILVLIIATVFLISWWVLYAGDRLVTRVGEGKVRIVTRVLGIVLAALAVQYVLNGHCQIRRLARLRTVSRVGSKRDH